MVVHGSGQYSKSTVSGKVSSISAMLSPSESHHPICPFVYVQAVLNAPAESLMMHRVRFRAHPPGPSGATLFWFSTLR